MVNKFLYFLFWKTSVKRGSFRQFWMTYFKTAGVKFRITRSAGDLCKANFAFFFGSTAVPFIMPPDELGARLFIYSNQQKKGFGFFCVWYVCGTFYCHLVGVIHREPEVKEDLAERTAFGNNSHGTASLISSSSRSAYILEDLVLCGRKIFACRGHCFLADIYLKYGQIPSRIFCQTWGTLPKSVRLFINIQHGAGCV